MMASVSFPKWLLVVLAIIGPGASGVVGWQVRGSGAQGITRDAAVILIKEAFQEHVGQGPHADAIRRQEFTKHAADMREGLARVNARLAVLEDRIAR